MGIVSAFKFFTQPRKFFEDAGGFVVRACATRLQIGYIQGVVFAQQAGRIGLGRKKTQQQRGIAQLHDRHGMVEAIGYVQGLAQTIERQAIGAAADPAAGSEAT